MTLKLFDQSYLLCTFSRKTIAITETSIFTFQTNENGSQGGRKRKASGGDSGPAKKPYNNFVKVCLINY